MNSTSIGKKLIVLRNNIPREEVARNIGVTISALAMYEQGNRIPRDEIKLKIAQFYNKSVQFIFFEE